MAITTMGVRAALRSVQETNDLAYFNVVDSLATEDNGQLIGAPTAPTPTFADLLAGALEKISAWIPSEALAIWLAVATSADLFKHTNWELAAGSVMVVASGAYAFLSSVGAHVRRRLPKDFGKATKTGILAAFSFLVYWLVMPGSIATADWHWPAFVPVMIASLTVLFLPNLAEVLKVEPKTTKVKSPKKATARASV